MTVEFADVQRLPLPEKAHTMWVRDELADYLHVPHDGSRVEIVGGEIVVSPGPALNHNNIVATIQDAMAVARAREKDFPWRAVQTTDLNLAEIQDGYIPDLIVLHEKKLRAALDAGARYVMSTDVAMAVEVASPSNAGNDRQPGLHHRKDTKWTGYARCGIPHYLVVDCAPSACLATLFADPAPEARAYCAVTTWKFGETITLPEPYGVDIETEDWEPWTP
ncbi:Uma2 family endonuclease [Yinghuangia sp. ASG 101]|uniref:Uma2 family endonuclease n=1 Tax=Yinghuangia sp. ASG 101 TaxID=2896848 RepID=UPI001E51E438|nr:Uma2 family endonuclease [Yinghuangia sp. ASG 101]UGQ14025.1 Uma2 family endonuclease [Yinghuangia sp. ASG 101]